MNLTEVKNLTIPEGTVSKIGIQTNQVPLSIDKDGSIFNGTGYIDGYRLSSSGELKIYESLYYVSAATGFIPAHGGDEIRIVGCWWYQPFNSLNYICAYDSQFNFIGACIPSGGYYTKNIATSISGNNSVGIIKLINDDNIAYVRLSYVSYDRQSVGSKLIVLNDHIADTIWEQPPVFVNQVLLSTEADDATIYNNGLGYKNGYCVRSGGAEATATEGSCTGYIKAKPGNIVRMSGWNIEAVEATNAINVYDASHTNLGQIVANYPTAGYGLFTTSGGCLNYGWGKEFGVKQEKAGVYAWTLPPVESIAYIRVTGYTEGDGSKMIVTINEDIEL